MTIAQYLMLEVVGLEADGKYLLVRLLFRYQAEGEFMRTVEELSDDYGVGASGVTDGLRVLEAQGLLSVTAVSAGRGCPKRRFTFTKRLKYLLEKVHLPEGYKPTFSIESFLTLDKKMPEGNEVNRPEWVDGALFVRPLKYATMAAAKGGGQRSLKRRTGRLGAANRLLVSVLLMHADKFGVVRSLGLTKLMRATGLSKVRLGHRLAMLVAIGVIRTRVPGVTSQYLFGRVESVYFLNLADPELSVLGFRPVVVAKRFIPDDSGNWFSLTGDIYRSANQPRLKPGLADRELDSLGRLTRVQGFFDIDDGRRVSPMLTCRLLSYASILLSAYWDSLPCSPGDVQMPLLIPDQFQKLISSHFSSPQKALVRADGRSTSEQLLALHECLFEAAYRKAVEIKWLLPCLAHPPLRDMEYVVLSVSLREGLGYLTLLALPKTGVAHEGCFVWGGNEAEPTRYPSENEVSLSDRLDYGLLSHPKRRVGG